MSTNVDDYSDSELLEIIGLTYPYNDQDVIEKTDAFFNLYEPKNPQLAEFFKQIQTRLVQPPTQADVWYKNEALRQGGAGATAYNPELPETTQNAKITDRFQKIDVLDDSHATMNRQQLGVTNTVNIPVAQDILNPTLKNTYERTINLDSQFRQEGMPATDYTLDLSDTLSDVLDIRLYAFQVPYVWYLISRDYGNTCFWVYNNGVEFVVTISEGNYTSDTFIVELNQAFLNAGFSGVSVSYNAATNKIMFNFDGATDPNGIGMMTPPVGDSPTDLSAYLVLFQGTVTCASNCSPNALFNNSLGWIMGFRVPETPIFAGGITPDAVLNLQSTKYFILVLDDFNQNHLNGGLVSITDGITKLDLPSYYTPTLPKVCINENIPVGSTGSVFFNKSVGTVPQVLPTAPRLLTQAQIYTINEIIKNREQNTTFKARAPVSTDTFAIVPIKYSGMKTGDLFVEFSGSLQDMKRIYFGPVRIERLRVRLLDDRGRVVNLNGGDWSVTLVATLLYQY